MRSSSTSPIGGSAGQARTRCLTISTFSANRHGRFRDSDVLHATQPLRNRVLVFYELARRMLADDKPTLGLPQLARGRSLLLSICG